MSPTFLTKIIKDDPHISSQIIPFEAALSSWLLFLSRLFDLFPGHHFYGRCLDRFRAEMLC